MLTLDELVRIVTEVQEQFQGEEDQGLLQRDLHKAEMALAGKYACGRILRAIEARSGIQVVTARRVGRAR